VAVAVAVTVAQWRCGGGSFFATILPLCACGQRSPLQVTARHQDEENRGQSWVVMQERVEDDDDDWPWCVLAIVVCVCFLVCGKSTTNKTMREKAKIVKNKILLRA
jgi:hypothetical protein